MPSRSRALWACVGSIGLLLSFGCARVELPGFGPPPVGHVAGRLERGAGPGTVVHLEAVGRTSSGRARTSPIRLSIGPGGRPARIPVLRTGQPLRFVNEDAIYHEVFTVGSRNRFQIRLSSGEESDPLRFSENGLVRVYCRLHPDELIPVLVTDADHFVYPDRDAAFELRDLPVGEYRVAATGLAGTSPASVVRVEADRTVRLTLAIEPAGDR